MTDRTYETQRQILVSKQLFGSEVGLMHIYSHDWGCLYAYFTAEWLYIEERLASVE